MTEVTEGLAIRIGREEGGHRTRQNSRNPWHLGDGQIKGGGKENSKGMARLVGSHRSGGHDSSLSEAVANRGKGSMTSRKTKVSRVYPIWGKPHH